MKPIPCFAPSVPLTPALPSSGTEVPLKGREVPMDSFPLRGTSVPLDGKVGMGVGLKPSHSNLILLGVFK